MDAVEGVGRATDDHAVYVLKRQPGLVEGLLGGEPGELLRSF